jgi:predicted transcriptional regulator
MKYRSRTDITAQILESANGSSTKTKIMYKAFLSYAQLKEYITVLVDNGLLEYNSAEQTYKTSPKGLKFLQVYGKMGEFVEQVEADASAPHLKG